MDSILEKKCVLMIAYYFPPGGGVGVQRSLKFAKYLPEMRWHPVVLTTEIPLGIMRDSMLKKEIALDTTVSRVQPLFSTARCFSPIRDLISRLFCVCMVPDAILPWVYPAARAGRKLIDEKGILAIYSTSPPHSSHLVGYVLKKKTGIPWVADFRDAWLADPDRNRSFHNRLRAKTIEGWQEKIVIEKADKIITVSEAIKKDFLFRYPKVIKDKLIVIPNGYDPDDFENLKHHYYPKFTFVLTSSMSKQNRSPQPLLEGVRILLSQNPEMRNGFQIFLVGPHTKEQEDFLVQHRLKGIIRMIGEVSHKAALTFQANADVNVFIYNGPSDGRSSQMMSGKILEYIGSGSPILAIAPPDSASFNLVKNLRLGKAVSPDSPENIAITMRQMISMGKTKVNLPLNELEQFHRRILTKKLASTLEELVKGRG